MNIIQSDELTDHLESIIHKETQQHENHYDLSVAEIYQFTEAGSLDFGGSEFQPAQKRLVEPQKENKDDDYGWWHLRRGSYQATMNEKIKDFDKNIGLLAPHAHTQKAGIIATTNILSGNEEEKITINFRVPEAGCNIKENARFAVLYLLGN